MCDLCPLQLRVLLSICEKILHLRLSRLASYML